VRRPLNVLVLGVGGNVSQSIQKALALGRLPVRVVAACISPASAGLYLADKAYISPVARDPAFGPWLIDICQREAIDAVLCGSELVLEELAPLAQEVKRETGAITLVSPPEVLRRGRDKLESCRWLAEQRLPVPRFAAVSDRAAVEELVSDCDFPLLAKPRFGKGSDGILILRTRAELDRVVEAADLTLRQIVVGEISAADLILQEYLGDPAEEYTAGCFCDADGAVRGTIVLRRTLQGGTTTTAESGDFPEVAAVARQIAAALRPLGPANVQLRLHHGRPVPFEINPRFSGTTALRARMGFNEVEAALRHFVLGEAVPELRVRRGGVALRYWNEIYVSPATQAAVARPEGLEHPAPEQTESWGTS
jgi:carbamoyl-phosphate synthase large subunit